MTEGQREAPDRPEAERYYAQRASLDAGEGGTAGGDQRGSAPELEADQRNARPHERRRPPGVGHLGVLLRLERSFGRLIFQRTVATGFLGNRAGPEGDILP